MKLQCTSIFDKSNLFLYCSTSNSVKVELWNGVCPCVSASVRAWISETTRSTNFKLYRRFYVSHGNDWFWFFEKDQISAPRGVFYVFFYILTYTIIAIGHYTTKFAQDVQTNDLSFRNLSDSLHFIWANTPGGLCPKGNFSYFCIHTSILLGISHYALKIT